MALTLKDRVLETTTTTGTGAITLLGAETSYQTFNSALSNADTTYYAIVDATTGDWEVGLGTYTTAGTSLSRDTVLESSNADSLVSFAAGTKYAFITYPADKAVYLDASGIISGYLPTDGTVPMTGNWDVGGLGITNVGPLACTNLTSRGIDDNTTGECLQLADTIMTLGNGGSFNILREIATSTLLIGGGTQNHGSSLQLRGDAATNPNDVSFFSNTTIQLWYKDATSVWDFQANAITTTGDITTTDSLTAANLIVTAYTVATLPTPVKGMIARVTDALNPAFGSTVANGGQAHALCNYNGAAWTVIGV